MMDDLRSTSGSPKFSIDSLFNWPVFELAVRFKELPELL